MGKRVYKTLQRGVQLLYFMLSVVFGFLVVIHMENNISVPTWINVGYVITMGLTLGKLIYLNQKGE